MLTGVQRCGDGLKACCPAHADAAPSLAIALGEEGQILLYCHAGCPTDSVLEALELEWKDLWPTRAGRVVPLPTRPRAASLGTQAADPDIRDRVYRDFLGRLLLTEKDRDDLRARGLTDEAIERAGYRSLSCPEGPRAASELHKVYGEGLLGVPGFIPDNLLGAQINKPRRGLVIPVRDVAGRIQAILVRTGDETGKYKWLSSPQATSGTPCHVPLFKGESPVVRITEGPLKADVATALAKEGIPCIGVSGLTWEPAPDVVRELKPTKVRIAFDADQPPKPQVERATRELARALKALGVRVLMETWDPAKGKGIDDALLKGAELTAAEVPWDPEPSQPAAGPTITIHTAADLMRMQLPEPRWAIPGLLPEGLTMLVGKPKSGKSWMALDLALAIATGTPALGGTPTEQGDVLYLALEDTNRRLQGRLHKYTEPGVAGVNRLDITTAWPQQGRGGLEEIGKWLAGHPDSRLVIVDTLAKFRPGRIKRGDLYQEDYQHIAEIKAIADLHGVAVLVLHHTRKSRADDVLDEVSGTTGLPGAADSTLVLKRPRGSQSAVLAVTGRDLEERELALSWDPPSCRWEIQGEAATVRMTKERKVIIAALAQQDKPQTPVQVARLLGRTDEEGKAAIRQLLLKMVDDGQLSRHDGKYGLPDHSDHSGHTSP
jgi:hypothetical protein